VSSDSMMKQAEQTEQVFRTKQAVQANNRDDFLDRAVAGFKPFLTVAIFLILCWWVVVVGFGIPLLIVLAIMRQGGWL
jgi:hypothetical protein